ncbi:autotransporter outer membrane beta-barrel domain-containing protein [Pedobacter sp. MC2016-05]|uniref:autotransporter outer membrane beta-barrel domain-containing protein n=1 Tax=Pedobacter sp. MC2016-05 TaxID=2994474 RepID=UPI00224834B6|nr:autotransporter outer membrane beta-barrel domain-containing protein [Pedobacter sp. MC2016-05]MCX2476721.1 autotransporter outer membrane beta-barrel domain-containing protein [Pedobacter sp. MC2016-05]
MKKQLLLVAVLCTAAFISNAQTDKGNTMIGGSIGYGKNELKPANTTNYGASESTFFNVVPRVGHFFSKNLAIGLGIGYNETKNVSDQFFTIGNTPIVTTSIQRNKSFNVGPFVRYYLDITDKFKFFGQANFDVAFGKINQSLSGTGNFDYQSVVSKSTTYNASINPGFAFFPAKKWAVEFSFPLLAYSKQNSKGDDDNQNVTAYKSNSFTFGLNTFLPNLGFNFHF